MKDQVVVRLIGGLGNQMFQYAAARAVADRFNSELLLDLTGFDRYDLRCYELGVFNVRARAITETELKSYRIKPIRTNFLLDKFLPKLMKYLSLSTNSRFYRESSFAFDSELAKKHPPFYMDGYWQTEKYFRDVSDAIRSDFTLIEPLTADNQSILEKIRTVNAVSLHVRRGDYVTNPNAAKFHGTCSLEYYQRAINYILERVDHPYFFVFSDDLEWVINNLKISQQVDFVDINGSDRSFADMMLMKECKHHIIANSSFSWWGAWLNPSPQKIVIAPRIWFQASSHDTKDLLPSTWIKL